MKKLVGSDIGSYTFDPGTSTITLIGLPTITLANILVITNITTGHIMLYNFADSGLQATMTDNVITLSSGQNMNFMQSTDVLQIWVDLPMEQDVSVTKSVDSEMLQLLHRLVKLCEPLGTVDVNTRLRVAVETMPTTTVTQSTTGGASVTGIGYPVTANTVGGNPMAITASQPTQLVATIIDQRWEFCDSSQTAYATALRPLLQWS